MNKEQIPKETNPKTCSQELRKAEKDDF